METIKWTDIEMESTSPILQTTSPFNPSPGVNVPTIGQVQIENPPLSPRLTILQNIPETFIPPPPLVETTPLNWLDVSHRVKGNNPAVNDDTYAPLTCTWYDDLVRIATIGEGSCFIHSVLKGFYKEYQQNNSARFRLVTAAKIRRDLAILLGTEDRRYPGKTYWETTNRGALPRMVMTQIQDESLIEDVGVDYSLSGLQRLFNSGSYLGQEIYEFISEVLGIDVYIFLATRENLIHLNNTHRAGVHRNAVMVIGNTYHYEVLAVDTPNGFQTLFPPDDPFLQAVIVQFGLTWEDDPFDPDQTFIDDVIAAFTERIRVGEFEDDIRLEFMLPVTIDEIFQETDPFRRALSRLGPRIRETLINRGIPIRITFQVRHQRLIQILQEAGYDEESLALINQAIHDRSQPERTMDQIIDQIENDNVFGVELIQVLRTVNASI